MSEVVGRDAELRAAEGFLDAAGAGFAALVFEGEPGIGKSALLAEVARRAADRGFLVLACRASSSETALTLAALADLLEPVDEAVIDTLPEPQRHAIDAALLRVMPTGDPVEQRLLGSAVRTLLGRLADVRPVLVAIDDAQWLDPSSAATLQFALRRMTGAAVGVAMTRRRGEPSPLRDDDLGEPPAVIRVEVGPLSLGTLHHVLRDSLGSAPARSTLVRIHRTSRGNPLFAIEIMRRLADVGVPPADQPLPVPADIRELVREQVDRLPRSAREALMVAAAAAVPTVALLDGALGRSTRADLAIAAERGIARVDEGTLVFRHPLFATAVYAEADDDLRREAHRRLWRVVDDREEQARHHALAAVGAEPEAADQLELASAAANRRGAPLAAAELMELALQSTPTDARAAWHRRSMALAGYLQRSGDFVRGRTVLEALVRDAPVGPTRARARLDLAGILFDTNGDASAARHAEGAIADAQGDLEILARAHATLAAVLYEDREAAAAHGRTAKGLLDQVADPDPRVAAQVLGNYVASETARGLPVEPGVLQRALELERLAPMPNVSDRLSAALGAVLVFRGEFDEARGWLEQTYATAVDEGDDGSMAYALSHLPTLELASGNAALAEELARRHLAVATELGLESQRLQALFNLALVHTHLGHETEARAEVAELLDAAGRAGDRWSRANGLAVLGMLELALGRPVAAVPPLLEATAIRDDISDDLPRRHEADLVESLVGVGSLDEARRVADAMATRAEASGSPWRIAQALRSRAVLEAAGGDLDAAVTTLEAALRRDEPSPVAFDRARAFLVLGVVLRRRRERRAGKAALESAVQTFERIGARLWAARAAGELDRIGIRRSPAGALTPSERRVVELAAMGRTNRQVATELYMSPKTVEANLARAYLKLGVRSRAELGAVVASSTRPDALAADPD
ncbi:MAG TPA: AAA family ATPase [Candidatus Limnocylindrales bacterium]